jgi:predicted MFS family arabinose efflux permease
MISQPATSLAHQRFAANIPRYFVYKGLEGLAFGLITTTWVIYLQQARGLSLTQVILVDVAFWLAAAAGEVPTGLVADTYGRKWSLAVGALLMTVSIVAWTYAPTLPLIMLAYMGLAVGITFLSGAQDALFYESVQGAGRGAEYTRLVGRMSATVLGAIAVGSVASGVLATQSLSAPFLVAGLCYGLMFGLVLSFQEPPRPLTASAGPSGHRAYGALLGQALTLLRGRPALRYPLLYLASVPLTTVILDTVLIQPQAVALGVPVAALGVLLMAIRVANMLGASWAAGLAARLGTGRIFAVTPVVIVLSLLLLAGWQQPPALLLIGLISFVNAVVRPLGLTRVQNAVGDDVRATVLSLQHLLFTLLAALTEPLLGIVADRASLSAAYVLLAAIVGALALLLFWPGRPYLK